MSEGFISFDHEGKYKYLNRKAEEILGVSRDQLVGKSLHDDSPGSVSREFKSMVERAGKEHVALSFEKKDPVMDRVYQDNVYPTPEGVAVFLRDITAEKRGEEVRGRLAERLELAHRAALAADWRWDFKTGELEGSANYSEVLGFAPAERLAYETWVHHIHPDERAGIEATIQEISKGNSDRFEFEYRTLDADGQSRWMNTRGQVERGADGKATGATGITLDITAKKKAELALRESEQRFRTLSEVVPQLIFHADAEGLVDNFNPRWCAYTGRTVAESVGWGWTASVHPEDRARVGAAWDAAIKKQAAFDIEIRLRRYDGEYRWFVARGQAVRDARGNVVRYFGTCTDVTYLKSAKAALQESEERFRAIFEQASVGVARVALDGTHLQANSRFCEITGYSQEELRQLNFRDLMYPGDLDSSLEQVNKLVSGQIQRFALKSRQIRKDETVSWIYVSPALVRHASGQPHYMIWVIEDINDLESMRLQLKEQKERLDAALIASGTGTFRWDFRRSEFQSDHNLDRLLGLPPGESLRGWDQFASRIVAEDRDRVVDCRNRYASEGGNFETVFRVIRPDGTVHWLRCRGKAFPDEHGQPAYMTGACVEITQQMETQQQLESSHQLLLLAQAAAGIGTWELDLTTGRMKLSPEVYHRYGIPAQQEPVPMEETFKLIHAEDRPRVREVWEQLSKGRQDKGEVEFRIGSRWVSWKGRAVRDGAGRVSRVVGAGVDVTEYRKDQEAKRRTEKLAAAGRLATGIAHEINNPLEALVNVLHLIQTSTSLEDARKYSTIGQRELQRVVHTARHALRFHHQDARPVPTKVSAIADAIFHVYEHRFQGANVELKRDFRDTQPIPCFADELRQLVGNLISNALDATPPGGRVILRVSDGRNTRTGEPGRRILVADTGRGMSQEVKRHLFEPFFSTKQMTGIGLGLWVSSEIVKRHGGTIFIRSCETGNHHGTVVSVFLPESSSLVAMRKAA